MIHRFHEEEELSKPYDVRLMRRLLGYAGPYRKIIFFCIFLLLLITGFDLSLPYLTKMAIDRHIVVSSRMITFSGVEDPFEQRIKRTYGSKLIPVDGEIFLIDSRDLRKMDKRDHFRLDKTGLLQEQKYYLLGEEALQEGGMQGLLAKYGSIFQRAGDGYFISYQDMGSIQREDLSLLRKKDISGVKKIALIFLTILLLGFSFNYGQVYLMQFTGQKLMYDLRVKVFSHLQKLSLSFFDQNPVGRLVTRATNDVEVLNEMFTELLINLFKDVFILLGIVVVLIHINWQLALVSFVVIPLTAWATMVFRLKARGAFRLVRLKIARINSSLNENISGMRVVQIFNRQEENYKRFSRLNHENFLANMRQIKVFAVFRPLIEIIGSLGIALLIWYGGGKVISETLSLGSLVAFLSYIQMFFRPIRDLSEKYNIMQAAMASAERIFLLLDEQPMIKDLPRPKKPPKPEGRVEFAGIWFAYQPDNWVLKEIDFSVNPGESVAIVGATGAGKTSIINLLERFYEPQRGEIKVDGINIAEMDKSYLRSQIGLVMQDVFLFAGDVKGNIRLGKEEITDERLVKMAQVANAHQFIERLPGGYDEEVKERGITLSVGQRQLLSFARALAFNPKILILDEATASIDTETESLIQDALFKLMKGRTSIIIAHRLSTIRHCDRILVMHKGRIVEEGSHSQLLRKRGLYYGLYRLQYKR